MVEFPHLITPIKDVVELGPFLSQQMKLAAKKGMMVTAACAVAGIALAALGVEYHQASGVVASVPLAYLAYNSAVTSYNLMKISKSPLEYIVESRLSKERLEAPLKKRTVLFDWVFDLALKKL